MWLGGTYKMSEENKFEIIRRFCQISYSEKTPRETVYSTDHFEKSSPNFIPVISNSCITLSLLRLPLRFPLPKLML